MRILITLFLFILFTNSCEEKSKFIKPYKIKILKNDSLFGIVKTTPSFLSSNNIEILDFNKNNLNLIDSILNHTVLEYNSNKIKGVVSKADSLLNIIDIKKYKFQFLFYLNEKKQKLIWVNAFCRNYYNDLTVPVFVHDGGQCYFNFKINVTTKNRIEFRVNSFG